MVSGNIVVNCFRSNPKVKIQKFGSNFFFFFLEKKPIQKKKGLIGIFFFFFEEIVHTVCGRLMRFEKFGTRITIKASSSFNFLFCSFIIIIIFCQFFKHRHYPSFFFTQRNKENIKPDLCTFFSTTICSPIGVKYNCFGGFMNEIEHYDFEK